MAFWQKITGGLSRKSANPDWGTLERYLGWAFGGGVSASGVVVNPQNAMQSASVYACLKVLAESVGMLPIRLYQKGPNGQRTVDETHPLYELLHEQPNEYQTAIEFLEMMVMHLNLRGNAYAYINRTRSGRVVEMIPLHPDFVSVLMDNTNTVVYRVGTENSVQTTLDRSQLLHVKGLTLNGWLGISPIAYARETIGLALATEKFGGQLFKNGAKMGGVLEHPGKLSDEAYKRVKESFDQATSGENAHKSALLEEGMKWSAVTMNANDSQFLETRKFQRGEIASIFRVPPHLIMDLERATYSNIEHMSLEFVQYSLMPWLTRIEKAIRRDVFTAEEKKKYTLKFDVSALLRGDSASRSAYYASGITNGWMTRNEARSMEHMNPIDGLDLPLMQLNMADGRQPPEPSESAPKSPSNSTEPLQTGIKPQHTKE
jgi:HK97 family phage portal protein